MASATIIIVHLPDATDERIRQALDLVNRVLDGGGELLVVNPAAEPAGERADQAPGDSGIATGGQDADDEAGSDEAAGDESTRDEAGHDDDGAGARSERALALAAGEMRDGRRRPPRQILCLEKPGEVLTLEQAMALAGTTAARIRMALAPSNWKTGGGCRGYHFADATRGPCPTWDLRSAVVQPARARTAVLRTADGEAERAETEQADAPQVVALGEARPRFDGTAMALNPNYRGRPRER